MKGAAAAWLAADERPWNQHLDWEATERGPFRRFVLYIRPCVIAVIVTALVTVIGQWLVVGPPIRSEERAMLTTIRESRMAVQDLAVMADFLVSAGALRPHSPQDLLKVVSAVQSTPDPHIRLWQLAWTTELFKNDVDGYVATVKYVADLPAGTRQWLIGRPAVHWVDLSNRLANIQATGSGLIYARHLLTEEDRFLRRELDAAQNRLALRRSCRGLFEQLKQCAGGAPDASQSLSPAGPR